MGFSKAFRITFGATLGILAALSIGSLLAWLIYLIAWAAVLATILA